MKSSIVKSLAIMIPVFFTAGCSSKESAAPAPKVNKAQPAAAQPAPTPPQPKVQLEGSKDGFKVRIEN
jgi:PBP1b-binding outer membrane lipoprotein LpoB